MSVLEIANTLKKIATFKKSLILTIPLVINDDFKKLNKNLYLIFIKLLFSFDFYNLFFRLYLTLI